MNKPVYYLWKSSFPTQEEFQTANEKYRNLGFRVVTYQDEPKSADIHEALKAIIQNHSNMKGI